MRFLLCQPCSRAWTAQCVQPCDLCGRDPVSISPFAGERRVWLDASIGKTRAQGIFEAACYRGRDEHKRILARGIVARGNATARLEASR